MIKSIKKKSNKNSTLTTNTPIATNTSTSNTDAFATNSISIMGTSATFPMTGSSQHSVYVTTGTGISTTATKGTVTSLPTASRTSAWAMVTKNGTTSITLLGREFELKYYDINIASWINKVNFHGIEFYKSMKLSGISFPYDDVNKFLDRELLAFNRNEKIKNTLKTDDPA